MTDVRADERVVPLVRWRSQQALRVHRLVALGVLHLDQVVATDQLGYAQLGALEVQPLHLHHDVEDGVALSAGAPCASGRLVPAPVDAQRVEDRRLVVAHGLLDLARGDVELVARRGPARRRVSAILGSQQESSVLEGT